MKVSSLMSYFPSLRLMALYIAGRKVKMAKTMMSALPSPSNNLELKRATDAGRAPDWFTGAHEIWTTAINFVGTHNLVPAESPRRFALPPIHLFWGGTEENQRTFFHHFFVLYVAIRKRTKRDLPGLTTREWRSILGNTYWKQLLGHDENVPTHGRTFDPNEFWKNGGPLLFGDELSAKIAAGEFDPTCSLPCGCIVQMETADELEVRQVALYHLNLLHIVEEIKQMERIQFPTNFEDRWKCQSETAVAFIETWDVIGQISSESIENRDSWMTWLCSIRNIVEDWDGFDQWDWGGLSKVRSLDLIISELSMEDFQKFTIHLLAFFIHSFVTRLGYYPSGLCYPPTSATHSCSKHCERFGHDLYGYNHLFPPSDDVTLD